jgi:hypothetical protein
MKTHRNGKIRRSKTTTLGRINVPFKEVDEALLGAIENHASKCNISTGEDGRPVVQRSTKKAWI